MLNNQSIYKLLSTYTLDYTTIKIKPWGFTVGIQTKSIEKFIKYFFPKSQISIEQISPRFLFINPNSQLSWQWHSRRNELWKVIKGPVGVILSENDIQTGIRVTNTGNIVVVNQMVRHRLVGLKNFAIVAEVWINLDINNPSNAEDIVRIEDSYNRL